MISYFALLFLTFISLEKTKFMKNISIFYYLFLHFFCDFFCIFPYNVTKF